ncbi:hydrogenase membrane subunit [Candidatus Woesearchaeota archaeon]|nr:hydrogenase membrane subunit [Candidatus Woesearchaeota archaeon]
MILTLVILSVIALILILLSRSARIMNCYTTLYVIIALVLAVKTLAAEKLPVYYLQNNYFLIDSLSLFEIMITIVIFLLAAIYAEGYVESLIASGELNPKNIKLFYITFNVLFLAVILAFSSNNLALLWIFAELTTVLSAILIVILNAKENITAALKYVFIASTAMLISFIGLIFLFALSRFHADTATLNWDLLLQRASQFSPELFLFSFILIFVGFAAKSGIVPFHTWLPAAYSKAPSDVSVLLSGSITNIGIYAIIRIYSIAQNTSSQPFISKVLLFFGILSIAVAVISMIVRTNVKKLIAFSSVENMGFLLIGIGIGNPISLFWVLFHTLAHSLNKALLFFSAGIIHRQYNSIKKESIYNALKLQPLASWGLIIGSVAIIGMPLFPLFISKFFILSQLSGVSKILLFLVLVLLLIAAGSFAWFFINMFGNTKEKELPPFKVPVSMKIPIIILIILLLILGIFIPAILKSMLHSIVSELGL